MLAEYEPPTPTHQKIKSGDQLFNALISCVFWEFVFRKDQNHLNALIWIWLFNCGCSDSGEWRCLWLKDGANDKDDDDDDKDDKDANYKDDDANDKDDDGLT